MDVLIIYLIFAIPVLLFGLIPTWIALFRRHPNRWLIAIINIAFGATILGWLIALAWALSAFHRSSTGNHGGESGLNLFANDVKPVRVVDPVVASKSLGLEQVADELIRLKALRDNNTLSAEEFTNLRERLLAKI